MFSPAISHQTSSRSEVVPGSESLSVVPRGTITSAEKEAMTAMREDFLKGLRGLFSDSVEQSGRLAQTCAVLLNPRQPAASAA